MADTIRQRVIAALKARAAAITVDNGFATDAGTTITHGWRRPAKGDTMPRIAIVSSEELPEPFSQDDVIVRRGWPIHFIGLAQVAADDESPLDTAEVLLADLKRAVFLEDRTLGGILRRNQEVGNVEVGGEGTVDREDGGHFVACFVTALITFTEAYGEPEAA